MGQVLGHGPLFAKPDLRAWGGVRFLVHPKGARGVWCVAIKMGEGARVRASNLLRGGNWRLDFGLPKADFTALMPAVRARAPMMRGGIAGACDRVAVMLRWAKEAA
jgi:hypothetical protein